MRKTSRTTSAQQPRRRLTSPSRESAAAGHAGDRGAKPPSRPAPLSAWASSWPCSAPATRQCPRETCGQRPLPRRSLHYSGGYALRLLRRQTRRRWTPALRVNGDGLQRAQRPLGAPCTFLRTSTTTAMSGGAGSTHAGPCRSRYPRATTRPAPRRETAAVVLNLCSPARLRPRPASPAPPC